MNEKVIIGKGTDFPLNGILTLPDTSEPVPAVVMVHGSGPSNMDEKVGKLTPFRDLAEGLAERGIASLRYDKRTLVHGRKMMKEAASITVKEETIIDALRAIRILKADPRIDHDRIYILGHSMGAMLAPRIDAEGGDVKGLIMMAGSPLRLEEILLRQIQQAGGSRIMDWILGFQLRKFLKKFAGLYQMSAEEAKKEKFSGKMTLYYFWEMGRKTAADYLKESTKPVLFMQGEKDFQALASDDFAKFRRLFGEREDTVFRLYPGLNHAFVPALSDDIRNVSKEYKVERHIGKEVFDDIAAFILERD